MQRTAFDSQASYLMLSPYQFCILLCAGAKLGEKWLIGFKTAFLIAQWSLPVEPGGELAVNCARFLCVYVNNVKSKQVLFLIGICKR